MFLASTGQVLEAGMMICFGVSWPVAIVKTWRVGRVEGKSLWFLLLVLVGYLCGIVAKLARAREDGGWPEAVTILYAINALLVLADVALYVHFSRHPRGGVVR